LGEDWGKQSSGSSSLFPDSSARLSKNRAVEKHSLPRSHLLKFLPEKLQASSLGLDTSEHELEPTERVTDIADKLDLMLMLVLVLLAPF